MPIIGVFSWFSIQKKHIRREVKHKIMAGMDHSQLDYFKMSLSDAAELNWEHSKEFEFNGEMYDVVKKQIFKDTVEFWCWRDNEETQLNRKLASLTVKALGQDQDHQNRKEQLQSFVRGLFFGSTDAVVFKRFCDTVKSNTSYIDLFKSLITSPSVPPPQ